MSAIIALFSGAELPEPVFSRALRLASDSGVDLVLLVVRHQHRARQLGEVLSSEGFLGRGAVDALQGRVKEHRNRLVRERLEELTARGNDEGVSVQTLELKGELHACVAQAARQLSARELVVARDVDDFDTSLVVHRV